MVDRRSIVTDGDRAVKNLVVIIFRTNLNQPIQLLQPTLIVVQKLAMGIKESTFLLRSK